MGGFAATAVFVAGLVACSDDSGSDAAPAGSPSAPSGPPAAPGTPPGGSAAPSAAPTAPGVPSVTVAGDVVTGLDSPWGIAPLPDGDTLVTSRDTGTVSRFGPGTNGVVEVGRVPGSEHRGEGGLLGLALSPGFAQDGWVYFFTTTADDNRILRMKYARDTGLTSPEVLLTGIPAGTNHDGGRIAFGPDGMLYAGTGEANDKPLAQDVGSLGGKILRLTPDGKPAPGNPFPDSPVYSLGHRNVQGLAWDSAGRLWASEFGQNKFDEINLITPGANYGWPEVEGRAGNPKYVDPLIEWPTDEASPSGIAIVDDVIYVACLKGSRVWQVPIEGTRLGTATSVLQGTYGRLRTVLPAPGGGGLWVSTSNTDGRGTVRDGDDRILDVKLG
ncbi:PQQ-dependent sugar dehydrogenase [Yinghuangia sp. ASG 101]|uniref:PQQ-dependent sugar dehydrogenase n=1 Tax=Yinghuangia sp. ASG 101 TaxID=2896848 RepID=UPI001E3B821B|nr:PQQ-dependent sugar dehydrogenase [Yinghuangia sp. ASG 101]UGQ14179.1 PQQ-dependent sugar dehydrogenase [Yinghuangia sp. ASG 101]